MPWMSAPAARTARPRRQHATGRRSASASAGPRRASPSSRCGAAASAASRLGVAERPPQPGLVRPGEVEVPLRDQRPDEREPVGVQPGRGQADDHVAGPRRACRRSRRPRSTTPMQQPDRSNASVGHQAGVLRGLAADQRAAGLATAGRDEPTSSATDSGIDPADGDVVEERERLRAAADDVVGAHRDEVDPDRVEPLERRRRSPSWSRPRRSRRRAAARGSRPGS